MLKVAQDLPIVNYTKLQPVENVGNDFTPTSNSKLRFNIDGNQFPMVSPYNSYLEFDIEATDNNCKVEFNSSKMGAEVVVKNVKVFVNNIVAEEIDNYNDLAHLKAEYGKTDDERNVDAVWNHNVGKQGLLCSGVAAIANNKVKCLTQLDLSGFWGNKTALPVMAFESVQVEIEMEESHKVLKVEGDATYPCNNVVSSGAGNLTEFYITPRYAPQTAGAIATEDPQYTEWDALANFPLVVGMRMDVDATQQSDDAAWAGANNQTITAIDVDAGLIRITFANIATGGNARSFKDVVLTPTQGTDGNAFTSSYKITNPQFNLRTLEVPPQMAQAMLGRMTAGAMFYDIPTYSCYKHTTPATQKFNTINIPCRTNRGKSILAKPNEVGQSEDLTIAGYNFDGEYNGLKNYQFQFGGNRRPDRAVSLENIAIVQAYPSQQHIAELSKALVSGGIDDKDLRRFHDNFVVGRSTSYKDSSEDFSPMEILLYLEYYTNRPLAGGAVATNSHLWTTYVHHIRRIQADPNGFHTIVY